MALLASGLTLMAVVPANADPAPVTVTGNDIRNSEAVYEGWHEGYNNAQRQYFVADDGLHLAVNGIHSQILNGTEPVAATAAELQSVIEQSSLQVVSGTPTFQLPLFFGPNMTQDYTTLRPADVVSGTNTWTASSNWVSSRNIPNTGTAVITANVATPLSDIIAALADQGSLRLLGYGVQAEAAAVVSSLTYANVEYVFAPYVAAEPSNEVVVRDIDVLGPEQDNPSLPGFNYESWHEGKTVDSSTVKADGLNLGSPGASTTIHGSTVKTDPDSNVVTQAELQQLITSASFTVTSGSVNFQVPVNFSPGLGNFVTLLSENFGPGTHSFSLTDTWRVSRAFGPYAQFQEVALGDLLDTLYSVGAGEVWLGGFGVQADSLSVVPSLVWDGTEYLFQQPVISACTPTAGPIATNQDSQGWTFGETRKTGHNEFVDGGLHVWTEGATSTDKAAGYKAASFDLADLGLGFGISQTGGPGYGPSLQLMVDLDNDGNPEGYLVYEEAAYGVNNVWLSSNWTSIDLSAAPTTINGGGTGKGGSVDAWLAAWPDAKIMAVGYSLGSGVFGDWTITGITAGCTTYGFTTDEDYGTPTEVEVDDSEILPIENYVGWGDGYAYSPRSYSTEADGAHLGNGHATQLVKTLAAPMTGADLEALITGASVSVVDGSVTYQIPLTYGTLNGGAGTFTTLRSTPLAVGDHHFSVSDIWVSTKRLYDNSGAEFRPDLYSGVGGNGTKIQLADLVAFLNAQGNVKIGGVGVQADAPAVIQDLVFNGTKYVFVPTEAAGTTNTVVVPESEIELSEPGHYTQWHEGYDNDTKSFSVDLDGLNLGDPLHSQILKGLETPVDGGDLYGLLTSQAGVTVVSGSVTYQVAVTFGTTGWSTLRSMGLTAGDHTFSLSDDWMSSKAIGSSILPNTAYPLGDILDAMNAEGTAEAIGFGVQADTAAQVSSITWGDTEYTFSPSITAAAPTITGTAKVGETLTAVVDESAWTPDSGLTFSYQWKANGSPISGAESSTYVLTADELGKTITVTVTGSLTGYSSGSATSLGTDEVANDHIVVDRIAGTDRYGTAAEIAKKWDTASVVFVATGLGFADALSAGPVAAYKDAPLLLTAPGTLSTAAKTQLLRLEPSEVVIVGGSGAVSDAVAAQIGALAFHPTVTRVGGGDRFATSRMLADWAFPDGTVDTAYIADGMNFPDALTASPAAAHFGGPVVLVRGSAATVSASTLALLDQLGVDTVKVAGGTGVVSPAIMTQLVGVYGAPNVTRNGGGDRYGTAVMINADEFSSASTVYLATGTGFADALAGAALAGSQGMPLFISRPTCIPQSVMDAILDLGATHVTLLGGTGVLSEAVEHLTTCG